MEADQERRGDEATMPSSPATQGVACEQVRRRGDEGGVSRGACAVITTHTWKAQARSEDRRNRGGFRGECTQQILICTRTLSRATTRPRDAPRKFAIVLALINK